jgi:hypothetical protein
MVGNLQSDEITEPQLALGLLRVADQLDGFAPHSYTADTTPPRRPTRRWRHVSPVRRNPIAQPLGILLCAQHETDSNHPMRRLCLCQLGLTLCALLVALLGHPSKRSRSEERPGEFDKAPSVRNRVIW